MWLKGNKIIDGLHLRNHFRKKYKKPFRIGEMYPELKRTKNTMVAEPVLPPSYGIAKECIYTTFCYRKGLKPVLLAVYHES